MTIQTKSRIRHTMDRLSRILLVYPTDSWEFASAVLALGWGGFLLHPNLTFHGTGATLYTSFLQVERFSPLSAETTWGLAAVVLGFAAFVGLFRRHWDGYRIVTAGLMACFWVTVVTAFVNVNFWTTATPIYGLAASLSAWAALRLRMARSQHARIVSGHGARDTDGGDRVEWPRVPTHA